MKRTIVLFAGLCVAIVATLSVVHYMAARDPEHRTVESFSDFDIPAGALRKTVMQFGAQAGVNVIFDAEGVDDLQTHALQGRKRNVDALAEMLAGTHVEVKRLSGTGLTIGLARKPPHS